MTEIGNAKPPARRQDNLADRIYTQIKADIFDFRLLPGDRFTETEIANRTGASRTPVRHALYRLQREGFLDVYFRSGWQVRPIDFNQLDACYEVRVLLEVAAARKLCSGQGETAIIDELARTWQISPADRSTEPAQIAALDEFFHYQIVRASGNQEMARIHQEITEKIRIVRRLDFTNPDRIAATYAEHGEILNTLRDGKTADVEGLISRHINESRMEARNITLHRFFELGRGMAVR